MAVTGGAEQLHALGKRRVVAHGLDPLPAWREASGIRAGVCTWPEWDLQTIHEPSTNHDNQAFLVLRLIAQAANCWWERVIGRRRSNHPRALSAMHENTKLFPSVGTHLDSWVAERTVSVRPSW